MTCQARQAANVLYPIVADIQLCQRRQECQSAHLETASRVEMENFLEPELRIHQCHANIHGFLTSTRLRLDASRLFTSVKSLEDFPEISLTRLRSSLRDIADQRRGKSREHICRKRVGIETENPDIFAVRNPK